MFIPKYRFSSLDFNPGWTLSSIAFLWMACAACHEAKDYAGRDIKFTPNRPNYEQQGEVEPYLGDDPLVVEAQQRFPTGLEFHQKVIWRTCTPNGGVCHNNKEYPDLRTPANFMQAFSSPCNIQPGEFQTVFDRCERPGDYIQVFGGDFKAKRIEIAFVERIPGEPDGDQDPSMTSPGLHIHLGSKMSGQRGYAHAEFTRRYVSNEKTDWIVFAGFSTRWRLLDGGHHLYGVVEPYQNDDVEELLDIGIIEGDANRNGIFGAQVNSPVPLLEPGYPEESYLIGRMRGKMSNQPVPGSRMPLANKPLTVPEMLAFFCLVEGIDKQQGPAALSAPIDYNACSYINNPSQLNLLGDGVTWESRVRKILEFNCGGCHFGDEPAANLDLTGENVYERLLQNSNQLPDMPLLTPSDPDNSYLYLKLIGDPKIFGTRMPYNPLTGEGELSQAELADVLTWIVNGAVKDE